MKRAAAGYNFSKKFNAQGHCPVSDGEKEVRSVGSCGSGKNRLLLSNRYNDDVEFWGLDK